MPAKVKVEDITLLLIQDMGVDPALAQPATPFVKMGLDSLEMAELYIQLDDLLGGCLIDEDFQKLTTPEMVIEYAYSKS